MNIDIEYPKICDIGKSMADERKTVKMYAIVKDKQVKYKNSNPNDKYLDLNVMDGSGVINLKIWNYDELTDQKLKPGIIVQFLAQVTFFNNKIYLQLLNENNHNYIRQAKENEKTLSDFAERVEGKSPDIARAKYREAISNMSNPYLKTLLNSIFFDSEIEGLFFSMYAAKNMHHTYEAGLAYHSDEVAAIADVFAVLNNLNQESRDLIHAQARLHDIGKIYEYTVPPMVEITEMGRLFGHVLLGAHIVEKYISYIPDFPVALRNALLHGIISHHGKLEEGAIVLPSTIEAVIVSNADRASAHIEGAIDFISKDKNESTITDFSRKLQQFFVKPEAFTTAA